jgi:hypothetical protein
MLKIISSIYAYKYHLFSGYSNGDLIINPLSFYSFDIKERLDPLSHNMTNANTQIVDMVAYKDILYILTTAYLYYVDLKESNNFDIVKIKHNTDCSKIAVDSSQKILFLFSEEKGLIALNIKQPKEPIIINFLMPDILKDKGKFFLTHMEVLDNIIFLSVRNFGIVRLDYRSVGFNELNIWREIHKIPLKEPQDVKYCKRNNYLYILDYNEGLVVLNIADGEIIFHNKLPDNDFPINLVLEKENAIIQGKNGVYYFKINDKQFYTIFNFKIGELFIYFNNLFYVKNNKLNLLKLADNTLSNYKLNILLDQEFLQDIYFWNRMRCLLEPIIQQH